MAVIAMDNPVVNVLNHAFASVVRLADLVGPFRPAAARP